MPQARSSKRQSSCLDDSSESISPPREGNSNKRGETSLSKSWNGVGTPSKARKGEDNANPLLSLLTVAEQHRQQAQEDLVIAKNVNSAMDKSSTTIKDHSKHASSADTDPLISFLKERLITFYYGSSGTYPHLRPVPLKVLSSIENFRAWVAHSFSIKDPNFALNDRSLVGADKEAIIIDSDEKLAQITEVEIISDKHRSEIPSPQTITSSVMPDEKFPAPDDQDMFRYAKNIIMFLANKGNADASSIITSCPKLFGASRIEGEGRLLSAFPQQPIQPPTVPRIIIQPPTCLIPGYYIFSPVFESGGDKKKVPIKIEIPRILAFDGDRCKTVSTYIGLGPSDGTNAYIKLEGDHLVGTVASRQEDEDETSPVCTFVFKNLRLKTRSLIRTVLDVSYQGVRTGRFFFKLDDELLPTPSRKFEIKAPSGYTIKMVNSIAKSNPVFTDAIPSSPIIVTSPSLANTMISNNSPSLSNNPPPSAHPTSILNFSTLTYSPPSVQQTPPAPTSFSALVSNHPVIGCEL